MKVRQDVEIFVSCTHFEPHSLAEIAFDEKLSIAQNAMGKIGRRSAHVDQIDRSADQAFEIAPQHRQRAGDSCGGFDRKEYGHVDVAVPPRLSACLAPE